MPASSLGRYQLVRALGRGGMGEVHLARSRGAAGFEKLVAIKVLDARFQDDPALIRGLLREAFLGVHLDHPHLVSMLDLGDEDGRWYVVMEYVRGFSLAQLVAHCARRGRVLPVACAVQIGRVVGEALAYLHALSGGDGQPLGVMHGDVSPANLLVTQEGRIKLADFGVAAVGAEAERRRLLAGKLPYLPPEALDGALRQQAWDVLALGVVLWELIAGRPRVIGETAAEIRSELAEALPPLSAARAECPAAVAAVVERAVSATPAERFASAAELVAALEAAVDVREVEGGHRAAIAEIFADPIFVESHGPLPSTGGFSPQREEQALGTPRREAQTLSPRGDRVLRFALSPAMGADKARRAGERLAEAWGRALGRTLRPLVVADYRSVVECLLEGEVDVAWTPPAAFVAALEGGAGGLLALRRAGGACYESAIVVRDDGGPRTLAAMRGASVAWVEATSAAGYLFARAMIDRALGEDALGEEQFHGSHRAVCEAVARGWAVAGATYASRDAGGRLVSSAWEEYLGEEGRRLRPVAFSAAIPGDALAYRPGLPISLADDLAARLEDWATCDEGRRLLAEIFQAAGLDRVDLAAYGGVRAALASARRLGGP